LVDSDGGQDGPSPQLAKLKEFQGGDKKDPPVGRTVKVRRSQSLREKSERLKGGNVKKNASQASSGKKECVGSQRGMLNRRLHHWLKKKLGFGWETGGQETEK